MNQLHFTIPRSALVMLAILMLFLAAARPANPQDAASQKIPAGLIVTAVSKGSPAEQAGFKPGDSLLSLDGAVVRFESQIRPMRDKALWEGKKSVPVAIRRGSENLTLSLAPAPILGLTVRPPLSAAPQHLYDEAVALSATEAAAALAKLKAAAPGAEKEGDLRAASWLWFTLYLQTTAGSAYEREALDQALRTANIAGDKLLEANCLYELGISAYRRRRNLDEAETFWKRTLSIRETLAPNSLDLAGSLNYMGELARVRGNLNEAETNYKRSLAIQQKVSPDSLEMAYSLHNLGIIARNRGHLDEARVYYEHALLIEEKQEPGSIGVGRTLHNLGNLAADQGKVDEAEAYYRRALAIKEKAAPDSLDVASTLHSLGNLAKQRSKPDEAEAFLKRALALKEKLAPGSLDAAYSLSDLGNVADLRGKLDEAQEYYLQGIAILDKLAPDSLDVATSLNNLGLIANERGKLDEAEEFYKSALTIRQRLAPDSLDVAQSLVNLGAIADDRGKLDEVEEFLKRASAIYGRLAPNSLEFALSLNNLGSLAEKRDKQDEAEGFLRHALTIQERIAPDSLDVALSLNNLGIIASERGKLDEAGEFYKRALAIRTSLAPDSLDVAQSLINLGVIAYERGKLDESQEFLKRALTIRQRLAPGSLAMAGSLHDLGQVRTIQGKLDEAEQYLRQAWEIVRAQGAQVAGDSGRQQFGSANAPYAADLLTLELRQEHAAAAFTTLEEGRAQALIQGMAERRVTEKVTPPGIWKAYENAAIRHNVAYKDFERESAPLATARELLNFHQQEKSDAAELEADRRKVAEAEMALEPKRLDEIRTREEMANAWKEVLKAAKIAPSASADAGAAWKRLPTGTLLLEFVVGSKTVVLFVVTAERVQAFLLEAKREELEAKVNVVRTLVAKDTGGRAAKLVSGSSVENDALRTLFVKLFPPDVQAAIQKSSRIVVSPDSFLWDLPFAALITNASGASSYLGLRKPLSYTQSLMLLQAPTRSSETGIGALIVGNPIYDNARRADMIASATHRHPKKPFSDVLKPGKIAPSVKVASARLLGERRSLTRDGDVPEQLPGAEQEAAEVARIYHTDPHLGIEPTEAWFRQHAPSAKVIHLASHGRFDPNAAQSSGILLAVPKKDPPPTWPYENDGVLQAWEVWDMKLKADLVILSACETGRGVKVTGEGLIGLTRAWQYAGAKTVVSSQWRVDDGSATALMIAFHRHLLGGSERDEALRLAMNDVAKSAKNHWSEPHHWAAFALFGETGSMR